MTDKIVTRDDALSFLDEACRNWDGMSTLSDEDIRDVQDALRSFLIKSDRLTGLIHD